MMSLKLLFEDDKSYSYILILSYFGFIAIGRLAFIVILHYGGNRRFGVLSLVGTKKNVVELNQIELQDETSSKFTTPNCNMKTKKIAS